MPRAGLLSSHKRYDAYATAVLADSPYFYWRFNEPSPSFGSTVNDTSGNGRTGATSARITSRAGLVAGSTDTAFDFPGGSSGSAFNVKRLGPSAFPNPATIFTVEAIVKADTLATTNCILSTDGNISSNPGWMFHITSGHINVDHISIGGPNYGPAGSSTLVVNTVYHVAMVCDTNFIGLYVNGVLDGSQAISMPNSSINNDFNVGSSLAEAGTSSYFYNFDGAIDEVAYYSTPLSATRLIAHAHAAGLA